ncbi:NADH dehydrogenase subunit 5 [Alicyclobacillus cycloheptanicus]|uniref:Probable inorganic carbon transporter subunit DabB n=1 Tax=Alicyclobacillus cycloheptanicus TaxID=1457 RepID=A0ABT9XF05_9BACL|nr:NADH dehydrogenase subunit 5 [Alicyclobacillus cycloheptanicus]MDQ0188874.1 NAD(P)H-quinone oxidoreductase subunit 5 [Alicyclobacillus cycloheptanicus]WDM00485.1 NADH dehydrogenase subunit 5 [Alicyclobacillus cycloheptanicus]
MFVAAFFLSLMLLALSAAMVLHPRVPVRFVRIHVGISGLPPLLALVNLMTHRTGTSPTFGPWHLDALAWLTALFVLTIGFVVQRYSVHQLLGDRHYRSYFALLTLTTGAASVAWLSNDFRLLLAGWGVTLFGLTWLIRLNGDWQVARTAGARAGQLFALSWLLLAISVVHLALATGHWQLSAALTQRSLAHLGAWDRTSTTLLLVVAVAIPAAQFPFQRWLLDSVVAPTPVSAVMHAGVVNAGGIILTRFAPVFSGEAAQIVLIVLSSISVLLGTGILLVQVDYKRQLVGSTIAQMGFMFIQCALGAYLAAIIHAVLHGLFKSALFLQAGSAVYREGNSVPTTASRSWRLAGTALGLLVGAGFWFVVRGSGTDIMSALLLAWSVSFAWSHLIAMGYGQVGRWVGGLVFTAALIVFGVVLAAFYALLHGTVPQEVQSHPAAVMLVIAILVLSSAAGAWLSRHRSSLLYARVYLWLVRLGEPHRDAVESHPTYLTEKLYARR